MDELSRVIDAAFDEASQLLRSTPRDRVQVRHKTILLPDGTPRSSRVTDLDTTIQRLVFSRLRAHLGPDVGLLGEEDGHDRRDALTKDPCAILDPLDGTRYWLDGSVTYALALAMIIDGALTGYVDLPGLGWRFRRDTTDRLTCNGDVLGPPPPYSRLIVAVKPGHQHHLPQRLADGREIVPFPCPGVAAKLAFLAMGMAGAMLIWPSASAGYGIWDVLPAAGLMPALGIQVRGLESDKDLTTFNPDDWPDDPPRWSRGIIAGPPEVMDDLRAVLPSRLPHVHDHAGTLGHASGP